jgi:hypothetical protein
MPVPTLSKTYQFNVNNAVPSQVEATFYQALVHGIKTAMIGFATLPWTVVSSSDSVTADASDNWTATTDLVWSTGNHSWIVLQQGAGGGQLCIDLDYVITSSERAYFIWSAGGNFTGGTISARPTASDEISAHSSTGNYIAGNQSGTPNQNVYHVMHSTDGLVDRVIICSVGLAHTTWRFEALKNPRAAHTNNPTIVGINSTTSVVETVSGTTRTSTGTSILCTEKDGTGTRIGLGTRLLGGNAISSLVEETSVSTVVEEWDNETWALEEHFIATTVGDRGPKGSAYDSWQGQYSINVTGDTMPSSTTVREFVAWGLWVWPWTGDSTIPQVT